MTTPLARQGAVACRRVMPVRALVEWAFATECARLTDHGVMGALGQGLPRHGIEHVMMQRGAAGARIDGGGVSYPAHDADVVADVVSSLPVAHGGRAMAMQIAELARACRVPDSMVNAQLRVIPRAWQENQHGRRGATSDAAELGPEGFRPVPRRNKKGVLVTDRVRYTPVIVIPTPRQIAAARRNYLRWWEALLWIRKELEINGLLTSHSVTGAMPAMTPWKKSVDFEICPP